MIALTTVMLLMAGIGELPNSQMDGAALGRRLNEEAPTAIANLNECYRANVLRLGASNSETADTLLRGVRSICQPFEDRLTVLFVPEIQGRQYVAGRVAGFRSEAEDKAITALLEARANRHP